MDTRIKATDATSTEATSQPEQPTVVLPENIPSEHTFVLKGKFNGYEGEWHLAYKEILRVLDAAKKRKLIAGLHNGTPEYAQKMLDKGFNLVTVGSDSRYITAGAKTDLEKLKGIKRSESKGY